MNGDMLQGFYLALAPTSILATALGALHGLICGMMPGLTTSAGIIILFPVTFILEPTTAVALLLGVFAGGMTGGSFAAILINIPGSPSASATTMDGYPPDPEGRGRARARDFHRIELHRWSFQLFLPAVDRSPNSRKWPFSSVRPICSGWSFSVCPSYPPSRRNRS